MRNNEDREEIERVRDELNRFSFDIMKMPLGHYSKAGLRHMIQSHAAFIQDVIRRIDVYLGQPPMP